MKKLGIIGGVVALLLVVVIVLTNMQNNAKLKNNPYGTNDLNQATIDLLKDKNYQNIILPDDLQSKIESGKPTIAYLFSPLCQHCRNFTPKLMPLAKELNLEINQLNVLEFEDAWDDYQITATPTLIYFKDGVEVSRLIGDHDVDDVREFFEKNGIN